MNAVGQIPQPGRLDGWRWAAAMVVAAILAATGVSAQDHAGQYAFADIEYGARLYEGHCITCHGSSGDLMPGANLRSGVFRNAVTDRDLSRLISEGLPGTAMVANQYNTAELAALVAYLRNMSTIDMAGMVRGDAVRGETLYFGKGDCASCHQLNGRGSKAAPALGNIGAIRTAATLQQKLLDPTVALQPLNRLLTVEMDDGAVISGRRLNEDTFTMQIIAADERLQTIDKTRIRSLALAAEAEMPSYADLLNEQEVADLVTYMLTLKGGRQ